DIYEEYSTIYKQSAKELSALSRNATRYISEYYTYLQALRESYKLLGIPTGAGPAGETLSLSEDTIKELRAGHAAFIYFLFLALEDARNSLDLLIDDKNDRDEAVLIALISEYPAWRFLVAQTWSDGVNKDEDIRHKRILARASNYEKLFKRFEKS